MLRSDLALVAAWSILALFGLGFLLPLLLLVAHRVFRREEPPESIRSGLTILSLALALLGGCTMTASAVAVLIGGNVFQRELFTSMPTLPGLSGLGFSIYVDRFAAFFLLLIGSLSIGVSIYSIGYLCREQNRAQRLESEDHASHTRLPTTTANIQMSRQGRLLPSDRVEIAALYSLFILAGGAFVVSSNIFYLILCLEVSTLAFGALVLHKHFEDPGGDPSGKYYRQSVKLYLIANHFGGMLIAVALLILAHTFGPATSQPFTLDVSAWYGHDWPGSPQLQSVVFLLLFAGFGIKAGIFPFHIWVAIAHPSSPTNTHAMSLGIMIKIALYGMMRTFFMLLRPFPWWWGLLMIILAALTAVVSVGNALHGRTLKEAFADHSVENIGIILAGIGLALIFSSQDLAGVPVIASLASLALLAGLYHLLNHTVFKGLLYLCTGAIEYLVGTVEFNKLGGIIHRHKYTAVCFLVGTVAIAGIPPFNGFISEWLTLQAFLGGAATLLADARSLSWIATPVLAGMLLCALLLVSAFAMTALAFVKIAGETLFGSSRMTIQGDAAVQVERDVPWSMRVVMGAMALLCFLLGALPWVVISCLAGVVSGLTGPLDYIGPYSSLGGIAISAPSYTAQLPPALLFTLAGIIAASVMVAVIMRYRVGRRAPAVQVGVAVDEVWVGGTAYDGPRMQYSGTTFSYAVRGFLGSSIGFGFAQPRPQNDESKSPRQERSGTRDYITVESPLESEIEVAPDRVVSEPFRKGYNLVITTVQSISQWISAVIQNGDIRYYLMYMLALVLLLFVLFAWRSS